MVDLTGQRFGRWLVLAYAGKNKYHTTKWLCRCSCPLAIEKEVWATALRSGNSLSCGCYHRERVIQSSTTHGQGKNGERSPEYLSWSSMVQRCTNPNSSEWHNYGGRGISLCPQWRDSFATFFADVGPRPSLRHSLERINNEQGYFPGNVRWALPVEQMRNKRTNRLLTYQGRTMTVKEWSIETGIKYVTLMGRINEGWPVEIALTARVTKHPRVIKDGKVQNTR